MTRARAAPRRMARTCSEVEWGCMSSVRDAGAEGFCRDTLLSSTVIGKKGWMDGWMDE